VKEGAHKVLYITRGKVLLDKILGGRARVGECEEAFPKSKPANRFLRNRHILSQEIWNWEKEWCFSVNGRWHRERDSNSLSEQKKKEAARTRVTKRRVVGGGQGKAVNGLNEAALKEGLTLILEGNQVKKNTGEKIGRKERTLF